MQRGDRVACGVLYDRFFVLIAFCGLDKCYTIWLISLINKMDYDIHQFSELSGLSKKTLRRRDKDGTLKAYRNERGGYVYTDKHAILFVKQSAIVQCPHCQGEIKLTPLRIDSP